MANCEISIIIPMYNGKKHIQKCVNSILNQTFQSLEIIIIDDGSKDGSSEMIDQLYHANNKIRIYHKNNGGASSARNFGIQKAEGDYILFVDVDDVLEQNMLNRLIISINDGVDIVICDYNIINKSNHQYEKESSSIDGVFSQDEYTKDFFTFFDKNLTNSNWNKLFKRKIIVENDILFNESMEIGEDACFNFEYMLHIKNVRFLDEKLYNYLIHDEQTIHKVFSNYYETMRMMYSTIKKLLKKNNNFEINQYLFYQHFFFEICNSINYISKENVPFKEKVSSVRKLSRDSEYIQCIQNYKSKSLKYVLVNINPVVLLLTYLLINQFKK